MYAIIQKEDKLVWMPTDTPPMKAGCVRIKVRATAVNRADLMQAKGKYPPPEGVTDILGLECSGEVMEVADGVSWPAVGDKVCALLAGGGYAEEVVVPAGQVLPIPSNLSLVEAAALPEVFTTAWLNLRLEGELKEGESVLVHAGASGVGTAAVQLCAAWGNPVVATMGSDKKCERVRALGATLTINRHNGSWGLKAKEFGKFDVILDPVGGRYLESNIWHLKPRGRLINIGLLGGNEGTLPLGPVLVKRLQIKGSVLRSRSVEEKTEIISGVREEVWPLVESGMVSPIIHDVMDLKEAEKAHLEISKNDTIGKILLKI